MVRLALANSRMKAFFDIHRLAETRAFDGETMRLAVAAKFTRRGTEIPRARPPLKGSLSPAATIRIQHPFLELRLLRRLGQSTCRLELGQLTLELAGSREAFLFADLAAAHIE